jgi:CDP-diacylglycerol--glycerol-3-phosphate 3-phosphatidyltransferase
MPSIYDLKPAFQNLLRPLVRALARAGVTANQVTVAAMVMSAAVGAAIALRPDATWPLLCLPAALLVRMALNAIDGILARDHGMKSRLGGVLNELGDVVSDTTMYLPLALVPNVNAPLVVAVVTLSIMSEMTGVVVAVVSGERRYDGPMGKSDRAFVFGVLALGLGLRLFNNIVTTAILSIVTLLLVVTIVNRARHATQEP